MADIPISLSPVIIGADGKSAYQLWLQAGNTGTLQDFLDSLQGGGSGSVQSVAGKVGVVTLVKADVGLSNVDNTADLAKPLSTAAVTALAGKADAGDAGAIVQKTIAQLTTNYLPADHFPAMVYVPDINWYAASTGSAWKRLDTLAVITATFDTSIKNGLAFSSMEDFDPAQTVPSRGGYFFQPPQTDYTYFFGKGAKRIRLALSWDRLEPTLGGAFDPDYLTAINTQIGYAAAAGLKIQLDLHNYSKRTVDGGTTFYLIGSTQVPIDSLANTWARLAALYEDNVTVTSFDIMNEPEGVIGTNPGNYNPNRSTSTPHQLIQNQDFSNGGIDWFFDQEWNVNSKTSGMPFSLGFDTTTTFYAQARQRYNNVDGSFVTVKPSTTYWYSFEYTNQSVGSVTAAVYTDANSNVAMLAETEIPKNATGVLARFSGSFTTSSSQTTAMVSVRTNGASGFFNATDFNLTEGATLQDYLAYNYEGIVSTTSQMTQLCVTALRTAGWTKDIYWEYESSSGAQSFKTLFGANPDPWIIDPLYPDRLVMSVHYYMDTDHSGDYAEGYADSDLTRIPSDIMPVINWAKAKGIRLSFGEIGTAIDSQRINLLKVVLSTLDAEGVEHIYFAGAQAFGIAPAQPISLNPSVDYSTDSAQMPVVHQSWIGGTIVATSVAVSPKTASGTVGSTLQLITTLLPTTTTDQNLFWSSSDLTIATVSSSGLVTYVGAGVVTITVSTANGAVLDTSVITIAALNLNPIHFLRNITTVRGMGVSPPLADIQAASYGLTAGRIASMKAANINTLRTFVVASNVLRPEDSSTTWDLMKASYVALMQFIYNQGFQVIVANGESQADNIAVVTDPTQKALYNSRMAELVQALDAVIPSGSYALEYLNEPLPDANAPGYYTTACKDWWNAIRAVSPNLTLIFQGEGGLYEAFPSFTVSQFDANTMYSWHPYAPGEFSLQGTGINGYGYEIPLPITRYNGGLNQLIADVTARINVDQSLTSDQRTAAISSWTDKMTYIWNSAQTGEWYDYSAITTWITSNNLNPQQVFAGEFGIVSDDNYNGVPALTDVATRARHIQKTIIAVTDAGFGGFVSHQAVGDLNNFQQTNIDLQSDTLIPEIATALTSLTLAVDGPARAAVVPNPIPTALTDIFDSSLIIAEGKFDDLSLLFQDRAGTTPVTASGQFVGAIKNKYGTQLWTAPTDSARSVLAQDNNGAWGVVSDGTDDYYTSSAFTTGQFFAMAFKPTGTNATKCLAAMSSVPDKNILFTNPAGNNYRTDADGTGAQTASFSQHSGDTIINEVANKTYVASVPHVMMANKTSPDAVTGMTLLSDVGSYFSQGMSYGWVLLTVEPNAYQQVLLSRYLASKAGMDLNYAVKPSIVVVDPMMFATQASGGEMPTFATANGLTVSGTNINGSSSGSFSNRGVTAKYLPTGVDGWFEATLDSSTAYNVMLAFDIDPTNISFSAADIYLYGGTDPKWYFNSNSGSPGNNGSTPVGLGTDYVFRVERRGLQWLLRTRRPSLSAFACNTFATMTATAAQTFAHTFMAENTILNTPRVASRPALATGTNVVWDGNSLTVNTIQSGATDSLESMASMTMDRAEMSGATMTNFGVSGQTTAQMLSDQSTQVFPAFVAGKRNILHVFEIYNDIYYNGVVADAVARYWQYLDQARAYATANSIDLKIIAWGLLDNDITTFGANPSKTSGYGDTASQLQAKLLSAHNTIKAGWSAHADAFVDPRASSKLYPYTAQYSWDGTHLYTIGYVELETYAWAQQQQFVKA